MSTRTKKIIYVLLFLAFTALLGYLLYYLFTKTEPAEITNLNQAEFPGGLPEAGTNVNRPTYINVNGQLVPASEVFGGEKPAKIDETARGSFTKVARIGTAQISNMQLSSDGKNLVGYNPVEGKFYKYNSDGTLVALSDQTFYGVEEISWAPNSEKAILKYPDRSTIYYNFKTKEQITFPKHWQNFDFSADSEKISFKSVGLDRENRWLAVAKEDGSSFSYVEDLGENVEQVDTNWSPSGQIIATLREPMDLNRQRLIFIGQNHENFPSTIIEGYGYQGQFSPDGENLFYSTYSSLSDQKPNLWFVTAKGENIGNYRANLQLETWADKCAFADNYTVYCAVPTSLPRGAGLVPEIADSTPDNFYKVDLRTASKALIAIPDSNYTAENLVVSDNGQYLYFTDKATGGLHQIKIK